MQLKPGTRLRSAVDSTEVVVVRAPVDTVELRCGGVPMLPLAPAASAAPGDATGGEGEAAAASGGEINAGFDGGTLVGKRYADDETGLELLCTKPGAGSLSVGERVLQPKGAKALPSSD
jgi:hypothetical protein